MPTTSRDVRKALLIGVETYADKALPQLGAPLRDVDALAAVFNDPEIGRFAAVTVLRNPTALRARTQIELFFKECLPDDILVFHFSGHAFRGMKVDDLYLAVEDTSKKETPAATSITSDFLRQMIKESPARRKLVVLDCCHAGAFTLRAVGADAEAEKETLREIAADIAEFDKVLSRGIDIIVSEPAAPEVNGTGIVVIAAARAAEFARESQNGMLSEAIVEGLRTGAADLTGSGKISTDDLFTYSVRWCKEHRLRQTPVRQEHSRSGDFIVAENRDYKPVLPLSVEKLLGSPSPQERRRGILEVGEIAGRSDIIKASAARARLRQVGACDLVTEVAELASETLRRYSLSVHPERLDAGPVRRYSTPVRYDIRVSGPPLSRGWRATSTDPAVTVRRRDDLLEVRVMPQRIGPLRAAVTIRSDAGVAEVTVHALGLRWSEPALLFGRRLARTLLAAVTVLLALTSVQVVPEVQVLGWCIPSQDLRVLTTETLRAGLETAADAFERGHTSHDCDKPQVHVTITALASDGLAQRRIAEQWPGTTGPATAGTLDEVTQADAEARMAGPVPDVWVPESSVQVELARAATRRSGPRSLTLPVAAELSGLSVASSPLVLALPEQTVEPAGMTWRDVAKGGWSIPRPDPRNSTTGLLATYALYQSTADDRGVEKVLRPSLGGDDLRDDLCQLRLSTDPPARGTAFLMPEKYVSDYNDGRPLGDACATPVPDAPATTLKVVTPATGSAAPALDVPCVPLTGASSGDEQQRHLAGEFCDHLHGDGLAALLAQGLKPPRNAPSMPNPDAGTAEKVINTWTTAQRPVRVLLAMDVSGSMKLPTPGSSTPRLNAISSAARTAVKNSSLAADDETGLWEFATRLSGSDDYRQLVPLAPATSDQQSRMTAALQALRATDQDTGLYDTISAGVRALRGKARTATKLAPVNRLVVLTDGENDDEDTNAATLPKLGALLRTAGVEVAVIATVGANCNALESLREFKLTCVEAESDGLAAAFGNALSSRAAKPSS